MQNGHGCIILARMSRRCSCLILSLMACGKADPSTGDHAKSSGAAAGSAAPAAKAQPPSPAPDKPVTLTGLALTMTVPGCTIVKTDDASRAMIQPGDPSCRALTLMGIEIRDEAKDFTPDAASVQQWLGGRDVTVTRTGDGVRLDYTARRGKGLVINRMIGDKRINCRGEGDEAQIRTIEAACMSLATK